MGRAAGFSLIELLVILALVGVLLLAAVPQLLAPDRLDVELATQQVAADMGLARRLAIARRVRHYVTFTPPGGPYTAYTVNAEAGPPETDFPKVIPSQIVATGTGQVTFHPSGGAGGPALLTLTAGGATAEIRVVQTTGRIQVTGP